jgi:c-di-GMP-binding flagellar brake protein YcgR
MEPTYQIGLQFLTLDERTRERLNTYIFKLQAERRRTRFDV